MRIISGKYGGRKLKSFQADHIRPTTDRVKESIFNKLMGYWESSRVLDLFSGTGNLGIEALSRGASNVVCVENHRKSLSIMRENFKALKIDDGMDVVPIDVFKYLATASEKFDIVLADPPFTESLAHEVMEALAKSAVLKSECWVVIESGKKERIDDKYPGIKLVDRRDYGDKVVSYFQKESS